MKPAFLVLTIAGSDSGAGAGIQADSRTIRDLGGFALTALTAITVQTQKGVRRWQAVPSRLIGDQVRALTEDFEIGAIKTGLIPGTAAIDAIVAALSQARRAPLVVDPVMGSTSGSRFLSAPSLLRMRRRLFPRATLVTPNWPEAEALTGLTIRTVADATVAARRLSEASGAAVLVKGGHAPGRRCTDILVGPRGLVVFDDARIRTVNTHGTGCVLSSAIACGLAKGLSIEDSVVLGRNVLRRSLEEGKRDRWGGRGPALAR